VDVTTIPALTLEQQSKYADYVTKKMMEEPKEVHLAWLKGSVLPELLASSKTYWNIMSYGNIAYILMHISPSNALWIELAKEYDLSVSRF